MSANAKGALFALLGFALFSAHDVAVKYLGGQYSTFQIIFFSVLFSFPMVFLMHLRERNADNLFPKHPWWSLMRVVATVVTGISAFYAFSVLPLAQTYAFLFGMPLLITILSVPMLGERVGIHRGSAVIVGMIGVLVVLRPGYVELGLGHAAGLTAAVGAAIGRYVPMALFDLGTVATMAILASLASLCIILAYKNGEASVVAPMHYSQMIWAIIYGYFFFAELPDRFTLIGACIIISSGLYVVFRESRVTVSENTPVLRNKSRAETGTTPRISTLINSTD
ncbi:MAG: DMT family transporter [Rhodobacteraceae bacterium]|nr:DMT family transporter [Paracoccaceae bacterium]